VRTFAGHAEVLRGGGILSRICGMVAGFPPASPRVPVRVVITSSDGIERWRRDFGGKGFSSTLWAAGGELQERLGPTVFRYRLLSSAPDEIRWDLVGARVLGLPLPRGLWPAILARESVDADGLYRFDVRAEMPVVGLLVQYRGSLVPE
jgi:hypothetical protein